MKVTLGGDRLGSGKKNKIALRNYERSTHNLSQRWTSSMAPGVLYPFLVLPAMRGDKFEIDLEAAARTIPTRGPLFGSYKMQIDIFQCPIRLYQAILHNNPTNIGLKMNQVKLPQLEIHSVIKADDQVAGFSNSCLLKYLGLSGIGHASHGSTSYVPVGRYFNAVPALAYYDIFKNYYSNKQEDNAYVIGRKTTGGGIQHALYDKVTVMQNGLLGSWAFGMPLPVNEGDSLIYSVHFPETVDAYEIDEINNIKVGIYGTNHNYTVGILSAMELIDNEDVFNFNVNENALSILVTREALEAILDDKGEQIESTDILTFSMSSAQAHTETQSELALIDFPLKQIDDMRMDLLSWNNLGSAFTILNAEADDDGTWDRTSGDDASGLPYSLLVDQKGTNHDGKTLNIDPLNGLMVKTYQSDLFNNWINTDWIDGENGIAAITAISTAGNEFKIDALNLAEKLYNMLNRIAVSGGTYEDWQDAVYQESPRRHIESPLYLGGMSSEIVFEEIVQTAPATTDGNSTELGTLGGRGTLIKRKGGNVTVKIDEASFIIGIVSLTPRIVYTQGNEFYMTDLQSLDDFHKPAMDGIGFQDLIAERLAFFDTNCTVGGTTISRSKIGKVPAWIEYMTAVDKAYGDFAELDGKGFMVLNRNYERTNGSKIKDATTYIDPQKYNYAFAYDELDAQNFWVQIQSNIKARRLMSAKQIPNI